MQVSTAVLSELLGISARQIQNLHNQGILSKLKHGTFDAQKAIDEFIQYRLSEHNLTCDLKEAQTRKELALAQLKEIEIKQKQEQLISIDKIEQQLGIIAKTLSNQLYSLPSVLSREFELDDDLLNALNTQIETILKNLKLQSTYNTHDIDDEIAT